MSGFKIKFNGVAVLQSLTSGEPKTGKMLYDDIIARYCELKGHGKYFFEINSKDQFTAVFDQILWLVLNDDLFPILHFEIHGSVSGFMLNNGEEITWKEFENYCRLVNVKTKNQLIITLATCFGSSIWKMIDVSKPAPYWGFLGPKESIFNQDLLEDFSEFYECLLTANNWNEALYRIVANKNRNKYIYLHCKGIFEYYLENELKGKSIDRYGKFKQLVGRTKEYYPQLNRADRRKLLKRNIAELKRDKIIAEMKRNFLMY